VRALAGVLLALGTACQGAVQDGGAAGDSHGDATGVMEGASGGGPGAGAAGTATGGEDGAGEVPPSVAAPDCDPVSPGRVTLQRLSRAEYDRTVRDLFGVSAAPAETFPPDSITQGFDNNADSLSVSPQLAELLLSAAETVAAEAMRTARDAIVICDVQAAGRDACAREILANLALHVFRRPATADEIDDLMPFVAFGEDEGDGFEGGIQYALEAMLVSPQFLYRGIPAEREPLDGTVVALDGHALATRLAYFLWGSTPDDRLLQAAADGSLHDAAVLRGELERMLADARSAALFDGFASGWLALGRLDAATPDASVFPAWDEELRADMAEESRLFFTDLVRRDGSALEFVNSSASFVNGALARLYGVSGISGAEFVPVALDPEQRAGVLTQAAILTMNSDPTRSNVVRRGAWIAESILCAKPPPPPAGVPPLPEPIAGESERERLARHRTSPSCNSCHQLIDPLGFALESFDAIGAHRADIDGLPVDDAGMLPDGRSFRGAIELARLLESDDLYKSCVTRKLATYALGRVMRSDEQCVLDAMGRAVVVPDQGFSELLWAIVTSAAFQQREREVSP
jgi:hypothetical protein